MRHGIELYQSNKPEFSDHPTPIFWLNAVGIVTLIVTFFFFSSFLPLALAAGGVHTALWLTNQQWGMDEKEIEFWDKYRSLPANYRKALNVTPKYVRELDGMAWSTLKNRVDNIYNMRQQSQSEMDLPEDLRAKLAAIESIEKDRAARAREVEAEMNSRYKELR